MSHGSPSHFWARCANYDELLDRPCPGWSEYQPGRLTGLCDTCGGRCGWQVSGPRWPDPAPGASQTTREWFVG